MQDLKHVRERADSAISRIKDKIDRCVVWANNDNARVFLYLIDWVVEYTLRSGEHILVLERMLPSDFHASLEGESYKVADLVRD